jgi:hypothetical protein
MGVSDLVRPTNCLHVLAVILPPVTTNVCTMTKCVKPLRDLATLRAKLSRSTNQICPFVLLSTHIRSVAKWSDALWHSTLRHATTN